MLDGQVAFITGAGRGQGRAHAIRLAAEGCAIIATDICAQIESVTMPLSSKDDLAETARLVRAAGGRIVAEVADVRDWDQLAEAAATGVAEFGRLDIVLANAGIWALAADEPRDPAVRQRVWQDTIDVNLTGVWKTIEVTAPHIIAGNRGGAIVITASAQSMKPAADDDIAMTSYVVSKHGLLGVLRQFAVDLAPHWIRVNAIAPTGVTTPMGTAEVLGVWRESHAAFAQALGGNLLDVGAIDAEDVSGVVAFLVSDAARYITGSVIPVDAGNLIK